MASRYIIWFFNCFFIVLQACSGKIISQETLMKQASELNYGNARLELYLPDIQGKRIGIVANQASYISKTHLVDSLFSLGINIKKIYTPEHGYRGNVEAGGTVADEKDARTTAPIISLYGNKNKPTAEDLSNIDVIIFDLQDVGVRFYTYISTLTFMMEACAENNVRLIVLDRPNPNGFYIDGPVLDTNFRSFVGMHPVPIVYGMTIGEYAMMVNGENWLPNNLKCDLKIIPLESYNRKEIVSLPIPPSPNLRDWQAIYLYPSLCLFEGTIVSVGRGTGFPFHVFGHPDYIQGSFNFTPIGKNVLLEGENCLGKNLIDYAENYTKNLEQIELKWLIECYNTLSPKLLFFNKYFDKLTGSEQLREDIKAGKSIEEIRISWKPGIETFKKIRSKYLIYPDF